MRDWLDAIPNLGVPGVPGVQPQKSATFHGTPADLPGVPGVPDHLTGTPRTPGGTPSLARKTLKAQEEHAEHPEHRKSRQSGAETFDLWRGGLARLAVTEPLHRLDARRWGQLLDDADWLLDGFGQQAARDGWSAADLFGVLPDHDAWGGVADRLRGSRSLVMTADLACWRRVVSRTPDSFARGASAMPQLVSLWNAAA